MGTCICMAESFHCSPETVIALLISFTAVQNKTFFVVFFLKKGKKKLPIVEMLPQKLKE